MDHFAPCETFAENNGLCFTVVPVIGHGNYLEEFRTHNEVHGNCMFLTPKLFTYNTLGLMCDFTKKSLTDKQKLYKLNQHINFDLPFNPDGLALQLKDRLAVIHESWVDTIDIWVQTISLNNPTYNSYKCHSLDDHTYYVLYAVRFNHIALWSNYMKKKFEIKPEIVSGGSIFEWSDYHSNYINSNKVCHKVLESELFGLDDHFTQVKQDIINMKEHAELMRRLKSNSGLNYLLHGPPGTGKSSFIKALAHSCGLPIYIVNFSDLSGKDLVKALNPPENKLNGKHDGDEDGDEDESSQMLKIMCFEDIDRSMDDIKGKKMISKLLNALQGVTSEQNVIRFFTVNNPKLLDDEALQDRMHLQLLFPCPSEEAIHDQLMSVFAGHKYTEEQLDTIAHMFNGQPMRRVNNYVARFLSYDDPLAEAIIQFPNSCYALNEDTIENEHKNERNVACSSE